MTTNKEAIDGWREVIEGTNDKTSLQKENARLRKALERITEHRVNHFITKEAMVESMFKTAREALNNGEALHGNSGR